MTGDPPGHTNDRNRARLRIKRRRELHSHLAAFLVVNAAVWTIWTLTGRGGPWPAWITGLCAIGLVLSTVAVYLRRPIGEAGVQDTLRTLRPQR